MPDRGPHGAAEKSGAPLHWQVAGGKDAEEGVGDDEQRAVEDGGDALEHLSVGERGRPRPPGVAGVAPGSRILTQAHIPSDYSDMRGCAKLIASTIAYRDATDLHTDDERPDIRAATRHFLYHPKPIRRLDQYCCHGGTKQLYDRIYRQPQRAKVAIGIHRTTPDLGQHNLFCCELRGV